MKKGKEEKEGLGAPGTLDWTGLDWTGLDWTGLDWTGTLGGSGPRWYTAGGPGSPCTLTALVLKALVHR
jgi:hypothetical protein